MHSTLVVDIDGSGTSELTVHLPQENITTTYLTSEQDSAMVTTTVYHDKGETVVESSNGTGEVVESITTKRGTVTTVYNASYVPVSVTSVRGNTYVGSDLRSVRGTCYQRWQLKEVLAKRR